jgi:hypothetical protein
MTESSRQKAQKWPYPRHGEYRDALRAVARAWFENRGCVVGEADYILKSISQWPENIILPQVVQYVQAERARRKKAKIGFPLHRYIHHGLSSQAMLFNLVGPLILHADVQPLCQVLQNAGVPCPTGTLKMDIEREDRRVFNEDTGQPTSIDLVIEGLDSSPIFIEAKLAEQEFGGCSVFEDGDCDGQNPASDHTLCYLHSIGRLYWERLAAYDFLPGAFQDSPVCLLAPYYQFFREVLFALVNGGCFVLLVDERNPVFYREGKPRVRGLMPFLLQFVPEQYRQRVQHITVQQVVATIEQSGRHADWIDEFKRKYGLNNE